jgi:hypothetical protein
MNYRLKRLSTETIDDTALDPEVVLAFAAEVGIKVVKLRCAQRDASSNWEPPARLVAFRIHGVSPEMVAYVRF